MKRNSGLSRAKTAAAFTTCAALFVPVAKAQDRGVYDIGQVHVTAPRAMSSEVDPYGGTAITRQQNQVFGKDTLDKSVNLAPGVVGQPTGGSRNEQNIYVRGFDRWQVPLLLDGVRVYLPADNRLDFGRFLTSDLAEVQIARGYASVLDGPGAMGGLINLVSRKPTQAVEGEIGVGMDLGRDASYLGNRLYGRLGTKQDKYYAQISGSWRDSRGFMLSDSFRPTGVENGGLRNNSATRDWNVNAKIGFTPNATDEYSLNYLKQEGEKNAPYHTSDTIRTQRYWRWPYWTVQNLSFGTKTVLANGAYIKTRLYWSKFDNALYAFDDAAQTRQASPKSFQSVYDDWGAGASVEAAAPLGTFDTVKLALHYRRDSHDEFNRSFTNAAGRTVGCTANLVCFVEPRQKTIEDTGSAAIENTMHLTERLDFVQGLSYDWRQTSKAQDWTFANGLFSYARKNSNAFNYQTALIWRYSDAEKLFANISHRARFPTIFERYSSRFGGATSNPALAPEVATNYQLGWSNRFAEGSQISVTAFYNDLRKVIEGVPMIVNATSVMQNRNIGDGYAYGIEAALDWKAREDLTFGGNATWMRRVITAPYIFDYHASGTPGMKGMLYAQYTYRDLTLTPFVEFATKRWTATTATYAVPGWGNTNLYYRTGAYMLANISAEYRISKNLMAQAGVRNLFDRNVTLTDGFPEAGRTFSLGLKATF